MLGCRFLMKVSDMRWLLAGIVFGVSCGQTLVAEEEKHNHGAHNHGAHNHDHGAMKAPVERPKVFLDKSRRIVDYQLKRLDNERLMLVERANTDPKYVPVYEALLTRPGISPDVRDESIAALSELTEESRVAVLLSAIEKLGDDKASRRLRRDLTDTLMLSPKAELATESDLINELQDNDDEFVRSVAVGAALWANLDVRPAENTSDTLDRLRAIARVPNDEFRNGMRLFVLGKVRSNDAKVAALAIDTLGLIPADAAATFATLVPYLDDAELKSNAVRTLAKIPPADREVDLARKAATMLVEQAESTPTAKRTTDEFLAAAELADTLFARLPIDEARQLRSRLRDVAVRVVRIGTVEEEMRYDLPYFAVQAGKPVQVLLENHDQMPHNLVITIPGQLKAVAEEGLLVGPKGGLDGKQYVPESEAVLFATNMVAADQSERLTFTAPSEPGEYPYVCTFPRHWMRMYGVMIVVDDLDAYAASPFKPKDPIGSNREFVQSWTIADFEDDLASGLRGRSPEIGKKLFAEATCALCHQVDGVGGKVGPALNGLTKKWKGNHAEILREILEPSYRVDEKYKVQTVITVDGETLSGIVVAQDDDAVSLLSNPEAKEPTVVDRDDIEEMIPSPISIMPKGLMDRFSKDEILEILAYLDAAKPLE